MQIIVSDSLFITPFDKIVILGNDYLVHMFLDNKIKFTQLMNQINKISNLKDIQKLKKITPKNLADIYRVRNNVSLKLKNHVYT